MVNPIIVCPHCKKTIKLTEAIAGPMLDSMRQKHKQEIAAAKSQAALDSKNQVEASVQEQLRNLGNDLLEKDRLLLSAQKDQLDTFKLKRELDYKIREQDILVEKRVLEYESSIRNKILQETQNDYGLRIKEKDEQLLSLNKTIEELKRKSEQGSQQLQGEVQELQLEETIKQSFPGDVVVSVAKGTFGADIIHRIVSNNKVVGSIIIESKRTKTWSDGWLVKLREDQRNEEASVAVIVTHTLPKEITTFGLIDGIWVCSIQSILPLITCIRLGIIDLAKARTAQVDGSGKENSVYTWLTSPKFANKIKALIERFSEMQDDLDKEQRFFQKYWPRRAMQIAASIEAAAGMYGDLQGITGDALPEIDCLSLPKLIG